MTLKFSRVLEIVKLHHVHAKFYVAACFASFRVNGQTEKIRKKYLATMLKTILHSLPRAVTTAAVFNGKMHEY